MSQNGKGDTPRPLSIDIETFNNNWERIFGKQEKQYASERSESDGTEQGLVDGRSNEAESETR